MVLLFLQDGSRVEISHCTDVAHKPGCLVCLNYLDAPIASFLDSEILGYSLNPAVQRAVTGGELEAPLVSDPSTSFTEASNDSSPPQRRSNP